jgi:hypothetical protein
VADRRRPARRARHHRCSRPDRIVVGGIERQVGRSEIDRAGRNGRRRQITAEALNAKAGEVIYLVNNLPYASGAGIRPLEAGAERHGPADHRSNGTAVVEGTPPNRPK